MSDLQYLPNITAQAEQNLATLNINSIYDLLFHLPIRYNDRTHITAIADLNFNTDVQLLGEVFDAKVVFGRRRMLTATLCDQTGEINLRFFHFNQSQLRGLADGTRLLCFGEVRKIGKRIEMIHPQYRILKQDEQVALPLTLEPVLSLIHI